MTATIFPAYGLARFVVSRPWAIAAAIGAVAAPPLAYAPYLLEEPLAYPVSTTALWAIAAADRPSDARPARARWRALCLVAPFVRGELGVLLARLRRWPLLPPLADGRLHALALDAGARGDWVGAAMLVVGAVVVFSAAAGHRSDAWYVATGFEKQRVCDHGVWSARGDDDRARGAAGRRDGRGVLLAPASARDRARAARSSSSASPPAVAFVTYAAVKGAYLSTVFSLADRRAERDLPRPDRLRRDRGRARSGRWRRPPRARRRLRSSRCFSSSTPSCGSTSTRTSRRRASRSAASRTGTSSGTQPTSSGRSSSPRSSRSRSWRRGRSSARARSGSRSPSSPPAA